MNEEQQAAAAPKDEQFAAAMDRLRDDSRELGLLMSELAGRRRE